MLPSLLKQLLMPLKPLLLLLLLLLQPLLLVAAVVGLVGRGTRPG
jgi:hypothetical protein